MPTLTRNRTIRLFLLATLPSLAGCFSLSRGAPPQQHYVLGADGPAEHATASADRPAADSSDLLIGLRPLQLADPFIVVRRGTHRVEVASWPAGTSPDHVVQVHILRFEGVAREDSVKGEGEAHLLATWEILRPLDGAVLAHGTTEVREGGWSVGDFGGPVRLLDIAPEVLAEDLVLALERALAP